MSAQHTNTQDTGEPIPCQDGKNCYYLEQAACRLRALVESGQADEREVLSDEEIDLIVEMRSARLYDERREAEWARERERRGFHEGPSFVFQSAY